jgi:transposase-like protein
VTDPREGNDMTVIELSAATRHDAELTDEEKRDAARELARRDASISGAELARRYGMKPAWGRDQARIAREGARRGARRDAAPQHGPPAALADAARRVNGAARIAAAPASKPAPRKPTAPPSAAPSGLVHAVTVVGVIVVAGVAAVLSYAHMRHLAIEAGEGWRADLLPLSVDGMMVVASMTALARRRAGEQAWFAWTAIFLGVAASLAANVAAAEPTLKGRLVAGWAPLALLFAFELLLQQGRTHDRKKGTR